MPSSWSVVTVTYNSLRHLQRHWRGDAERRDFTWIVVDNGSTDGTVEFAREHADIFVESGRNGGFSLGNNLGLDRVTTEFVAFANPDVTVDASGWQGIFEQTIAESGGLVAPQLVNVDGTDQLNARGLPFLSAKIRNRIGSDTQRGREYARAGFAGPTYCAWVMGAALAGRTEDLRRLGGWNDSYFLYYEDHEIGLRAWRAGMPVVLQPAVRWVHAWQRETTRANLRAWKAEFASMRTFYLAHPEFLIGGARSRRLVSRIKRAGYGEMVTQLWCPLRPNAESDPAIVA